MGAFKKFFFILFLPTATLFLLSYFISLDFVSQRAHEQSKQLLKDQWSLLSAVQLSSSFDAKTNSMLQSIEQKSSVRVTLISPDGAVIMDSSVIPLNLDSVENHAHREEIRTVINGGEPIFAMRYSRTTSQNRIYYADLLPNGNVLRVSYPATFVDNVKSSLQNSLLTLLGFMLVISAIIAAAIASKIAGQYKQLDTLAIQLEKGGENIEFPQFKDRSMQKISAVVYRIHNALKKEQQISKTTNEQLNHIFTTMKEGIILMDKNAVVYLSNRQAEKYLNLKLPNGMNVVNDQKSLPLITFFSNVITAKNDQSMQLTYNEKVYDVYVKTIDEKILMVLTNITEKSAYTSYKSELVGNLSHELKTPLTLIMGASETIQKNRGMDEAQREKFLDTIQRNAVRLNNLLNDIITLHRLETVGTQERVTEPASLVEIEKEIIDVYSNRGKTLNFMRNADFVNIEYSHIMSVVSNLVSNAIAYSSGGEIDINIGKEKDTVTVTVNDEGPAIPEHEKERIFERFYTVSKARTRSGSGNGLGLSIVKHISKLYHGDIKVKSNVKGGNSFIIVLKERI